MTAHWEKKGEPSAPRVEHKYCACDRINGKNVGGVKITTVLIFCILIKIQKPRTKSTHDESDDEYVQN